MLPATEVSVSSVDGQADTVNGYATSGRGGPQFIPRPELWRPGRPAPWFAKDVDPAAGELDLDRVRHVFPEERRGRMSPVATSGAIPSAVLVAFFMADETPTGEPGANGPSGEPVEQPYALRSRDVTGPGTHGLHVLLTRRSWGLRTHSGEMAFPGGRCELDESTRDAAVREAWEETGLDPGDVETLGELDHLTTVTRRAYIVPQVAVIEAAPLYLRASPAEVDQILAVPVSELLSGDVYREEQWGAPGQHRPIYFFELIGNTVWGATAAILRQCLAMLVGADPGSLVDLDPARMAPKGYRMDPAYRNRVL